MDKNRMEKPSKNQCGLPAYPLAAPLQFDWYTATLKADPKDLLAIFLALPTKFHISEHKSKRRGYAQAYSVIHDDHVVG